MENYNDHNDLNKIKFDQLKMPWDIHKKDNKFEI